MRRRGSATVTRHWFAWDEPFLPAVAGWLIDAADPGHVIDLGASFVVVPGRRAGRLLIAHLIDASRARARVVVPPRPMTPGDLAEAFLKIDRPMATRVERRFAWSQALRVASAAALAPLVPDRPEDDDLLAWFALGSRIADLDEELAGACLTFSDVPEHASDVGLFTEADRWETLATLTTDYRQHLTACGLDDPHEGLPLALARGDVNAAPAVVLVGVTELNPWQEQLLARVPKRVDVLVHAPEDEADAFDVWGRPDEEAWGTRALLLSDDKIVIADQPPDQARAALRRLADIEPSPAIDEVALGTASDDLVDVIVRTASDAGIDVHRGQGMPVARTAPYRLLAAVADWMASRRFEHVAALVRHPDLEPWWGAHGDDAIGTLVGELDRHHQLLLPARFDDEASPQQPLAALQHGLTRLLSGFEKGTAHLASWSNVIIAFLAEVYGDEDAASDRAASVLALAEVCRRLAEAQIAEPELSAATALRLVLTIARHERIAAPARDDQVELLGWLELHLDSAPTLVIVGVNDGAIPEAVRGDAFLPDRLRGAIGLSDNRTRYARDAYLLTAINRSRRLCVVAGRRDRHGEPLTPSRLLLATDDDTLLRRLRQFCEVSESTSIVGDERSTSQFVVPPLVGVPTPSTMRVTDFRAYLTCPYRYALRRLLDVREVRDDGRELNPLQFGTLAHAVLEAFGKDEAWHHVTDAGAIGAHLRKLLDAELRARYGHHPRPSIRLQAARLEQRLTAFAGHHAMLRDAGWRTTHVEEDLSDGSLEVPGDAAMPLRGTIDRIDRHETTGAWRVIDYKTGERGDTPHQSHHGTRSVGDGPLVWRDLQLPLYEYLLRQRGFEGPIELAYIVLPKRLGHTALRTATWGPAHLADAIEHAQNVVRSVRSGDFPLNVEHRPLFDPFRRLCQTTAFAAGAGDDGSEA